ncbi:MAG TPA: 2'-deoxycytidine 5'-triphosphate deaminase, partial [Hyphomicrobiales bacterium]|nr:2'-deoxycytidine 5'-triphosphate deaminase [Hyphomicrobiales bacterium]
MASPQPAQQPAAAKAGILPSHAIQALVAAGAIRLAKPLVDGQVQPASLDLRLGPRAIRVRASFLPGRRMRVADRLEELALHEIDLSAGAVLETGCVYIVPLLEALALEAGIAAAANPKSSTGRLDVFTRVIADHAQEFDKIDPGYQGPLYAEISPRTFPVLVREGSRLAQIRFRSGHAVCSDAELSALHESEGLVLEAEANIDGGLALSVDLRGEASGLVGFRAKRHTALVDVDKVGAYQVLDFWEPIFSHGQSSLILD